MLEAPISAQNRNRTSDTRIFSPLLYQLSYLGVSRRFAISKGNYTHNPKVLQLFFRYRTPLSADTIFSTLIGLLICAFIPTFSAI